MGKTFITIVAMAISALCFANTPTIGKNNGPLRSSVNKKAASRAMQLNKYNTTIFDNQLMADSMFKTLPSNSFLVKYTKIEGGVYKYRFHLEGQVKNCDLNNKVPHAFISLNSALTPDKYVIIPTNTEGHFSIDIDDDSIGGITIIKKGYQDKEIALPVSIAVNENTAYAFEVCIGKIDEEDYTPLEKKTVAKKSSKVYFDFNKATLKKETTKQLDNFIASLNKTKSKGASIEINGYTDNMGTKKYNLQLSKARSVVCKEYLLAHGLGNVRIKVNALGSDDEIINTKSESERAKQRRAEIILHPLHE